MLSRRDSWGAEYVCAAGDGVKGLGGGKKVPTWTDPGLPLTYTSSHKIMAGELAALQAGATLKRKADEETGRNACMPLKKPRLSNIGVELKKMKEGGEKKRLRDKTVAADKEEKERYYTGSKPELRDAVQIVDTLMRSATETEKQNAMLEAMLLENEARYGKDTDEMFDEWLAYIEVKRVEVDRIHEDHRVEIKDRDGKIEALETEAKGFRARLDKEKKKVKVRDERLAQVKSYWVQEQNLMDRKFREMEEMTVDLDELSELNYETDESDDEEADFGAEPEKAGEEAKVEQKLEEPKEVKEVKKVKEVKEVKETKEAKEAKEAKEPEANGPTGQELAKSLARERVKNVSAMDLIDLAEDEDDESEDEGPISSQRKLRSKPAQTL